MTIHSTWYGYAIKIIDGVSRFTDTNEPTVGSNRPCGYCHEHPTPEGHDDCLGKLPGVMNACCGHGEAGDTYVQFPGGELIHGVEARRLIAELKKSRKWFLASVRFAYLQENRNEQSTDSCN